MKVFASVLVGAGTSLAVFKAAVTVKDITAFDSTTGKFSEPVAEDPSVIPPTPAPAPENPEADAMEAVLDHEVRLIQLELGTNTTK